MIIMMTVSSVTGQYPHIAVLENDANEAQLPSHYKNEFLKQPHVRALLAKSSWFGPGENQVSLILHTVQKFL